MKDFFESLQIIDNELTAKTAKTGVEANEEYLEILSAKLDAVALMAVAAIELLQEEGVAQHRVAKKMQEIDLRDGRLDGKLAAHYECQSCGNRVNKKRKFCHFCGATIQRMPT